MRERQARPRGAVRIHDSSVSVWEEPEKVDSAYEAEFRKAVLAGIIRLLRARGWRVGRDPRVHKNYPILDKSHRYCTHPSRLEATLEQCGRHIEICLFQSVANGENKHGARYDFDKLGRMPHLLRLRSAATMAAVAEWLCAQFGYEGPGVSRLELMRSDAQTNREHIKSARAREFRRPPEDHEIHDYNRRTADGQVLHIGDRVWFRDYKDRWLTGIAEYGINNMWWVLWGESGRFWEACFNLYRTPPANPRIKCNAELRRERLTKLMRKAADEDRFLRAEQLRRVLASDSEKRSRLDAARLEAA